MVKTSPSSAGDAGSIPEWRAKIPHTLQSKHQNLKQKQHCNKFNKDFKNGPHQKNKERERISQISTEGQELPLHISFSNPFVLHVLVGCAEKPKFHK